MVIHTNRVAEIQAVSSRWRSLSCKYFRAHHDYNDGRVDEAEMSLDYFSYILYVAGVRADLPTLKEFCRASVGDNLRFAWDTVASFAEKVKEQILSTDYSLVYVSPGKDFDDLRMTSQGTSPVKKQGSGRVLCTSEFGMVRSTNSKKPGDTGPGRLESELLTKAVVIFESEVDAMFSRSSR